MTSSPPTPAPKRAMNLAGICTLAVLVLVTLVGGVVVIVHPATLDFAAYVRDLAIAWGLLGIGHGIDPNSRP